MIYGFDSYREVLKQEIENRVSENSLYSANSFSKKIGLSQSYLSLILNGKRNLSVKAAEKVVNVLQYSDLERDFFLYLVMQEAAEGEELKTYYKDKVKQLKRDHQVDQIDIEKFHVISDWYYSAILECLNIDNIEQTPESFGKHLNIDSEKVKDALRVLLRLGLVKYENENYRRVDSGYISTSPEIKSKGLKKFHKQALKKAISAIESEPIEKRHVTGITLAIDPKKLPAAKEKIQSFMEELMDFLEDGERSEVYQLSNQLFKLKEYEKESP